MSGFLPNQAATQTLSYMTGGGSFSGSQVLKEVSLSDTYARSFDTNRQGRGPEGGGYSIRWFDALCIGQIYAMVLHKQRGS